MFNIWNVREWLREAIESCNERGLDPEDSIFALFLFSSLDRRFLEFFKDFKDQISSYSGKNVHLLTPTVFRNNTITDSDWRLIRKELIESGVRVSNRPCVVFFSLKKSKTTTGYHPNYLAAFQLPGFDEFETKLIDVIDICIDFGSKKAALVSKLGALLSSSNLIVESRGDFGDLGRNILEVLESPRVFISYSHKDRGVADKLCSELNRSGVSPWIDVREIEPGEYIGETVREGLQKCDILVAILSENSINSEWLRYETGFFSGTDFRKPIIPVVIDAVGREMAKKLPFADGRLYVDINESDGFGKVIEGVERIRRRRP